jgi:predicted Zn-dependent protease
MSRAMALSKVGEGLGSFVDAKKPQYTQAFGQLYGIGTTVTLELPHSRSQESEAYKMGLFHMARAGYDPEESVHFWERFAAYAKAQGAGKPNRWLSTHPDDGTRIKQLKELMPEAKKLYHPQ